MFGLRRNLRRFFERGFGFVEFFTGSSERLKCELVVDDDARFDLGFRAHGLNSLASSQCVPVWSFCTSSRATRFGMYVRTLDGLSFDQSESSSFPSGRFAAASTERSVASPSGSVSSQCSSASSLVGSGGTDPMRCLPAFNA